jgi:hypothetical protein
MQVKMNKNLLFFVINIFLFVLTLWKAIPIWFLFLFFSIFYFVKLIKKGTATIPMKKIDVTYSYGVLDNYADDGDEDDKNFGLFIELMKQPVFVDIKEDKYLDKRKKIALHLFINSNPKFKESFISSIGLHSTDTDRAEVFWEPTGYTLLSLEKLEFVVSKK